MRSRLLMPFASVIVVGVFAAGTARGQVAVGVGGGVGPGWAGPGGPMWTYYGLPGGPFAPAWPFYAGATRSFWTNGLHLAGPPIPVYGPVPGVLGAEDFTRQWKHHPSLGWNYGWFGVYAASPRPRPLTVSVWPQGGPGAYAGHGPVKVYGNGVVSEAVGGPGAPPAAAGGCLVLSVKVPQPSAEVFVDGVRTAQTGTDRLFESPPLEAGKEYAYELTARWVEGGATVERKKVVTGKPGEVVRVDLTAAGGN
jgi:uncharacterized protein (TIGR03000 family)